MQRRGRRKHSRCRSDGGGGGSAATTGSGAAPSPSRWVLALVGSTPGTAQHVTKKSLTLHVLAGPRAPAAAAAPRGGPAAGKQRRCSQSRVHRASTTAQRCLDRKGKGLGGGAARGKGRQRGHRLGCSPPLQSWQTLPTHRGGQDADAQQCKAHDDAAIGLLGRLLGGRCVHFANYCDLLPRMLPQTPWLLPVRWRLQAG